MKVGSIIHTVFFYGENNVPPYANHFMMPKEKFYVKYLSSYSKTFDSRKCPPIRGKISPRGSMSPDMQILYVPNYTPYFEFYTNRDMDFRKCHHYCVTHGA